MFVYFMWLTFALWLVSSCLCEMRACNGQTICFENPTLLVLNLTPTNGNKRLPKKTFKYVQTPPMFHMQCLITMFWKFLGRSSTGVSGCDLLQCRHFCLRKSWGVANRCEALGRAAGDSTGASSVGHGSKSPLASARASYGLVLWELGVLLELS